MIRWLSNIIMANFNEDLFGCFSELPICLFGCCVPAGACCLQATAVDKCYGQGKFVPFLFVCSLGCIGGAINRGKIRLRYSLEGSFCGDLLTWWICGTCAGIQEYKEARNRSR